MFNNLRDSRRSAISIPRQMTLRPRQGNKCKLPSRCSKMASKRMIFQQRITTSHTTQTPRIRLEMCEWMISLNNTAPWGISRPSQKPKDGQPNNSWRTTSSIRQTRSRKWERSAKNYFRRQQGRICHHAERTWALRAALVAHANHRGQEEELLLMSRDKMNIARNSRN